MRKSKKCLNRPNFSFGSTVWEQRKFSEIYKKVSEKNDLTFGSDRVISVANMYFKDSENLPDSSKSYMKTYNIMRKGDIAFEGNKSKNFSYGRFVENSIGDGIVSHVFEVFRPTVEYNLEFWKYLINYENIMGPILVHSTNKATMMTNLVSTDFLKQHISVPKVSEQEKIGSFINKIDTFIVANERKVKNLKTLKKLLMQNIFNQTWRFAGFTEPWEQRKLGDFVEILTGTSGNIKLHEGDYKISRIETISNGIIDMDKVGYENYKPDKKYLLNKGDILFSNINAINHIGKNAVYDVDIGLYHGINLLRLVPNDINSGFLYNYLNLNSIRNWDKSHANQAVNQASINTSSLKTMPVNVPKEKPEQSNIANLFWNVSRVIVANER